MSERLRISRLDCDHTLAYPGRRCRDRSRGTVDRNRRGMIDPLTSEAQGLNRSSPGQKERNCGRIIPKTAHRLHIVARVASADRMAHALIEMKKSRCCRIVHDRRMQVKYERHDRFMPTRLQLLGTHRQPAALVPERRFVRVLGSCCHRPVHRAGEFPSGSPNGVCMRHLRRLDRREDGALSR